MIMLYYRMPQVVSCTPPITVWITLRLWELSREVHCVATVFFPVWKMFYWKKFTFIYFGWSDLNEKMSVFFSPIPLRKQSEHLSASQRCLCFEEGEVKKKQSQSVSSRLFSVHCRDRGIWAKGSTVRHLVQGFDPLSLCFHIFWVPVWCLLKPHHLSDAPTYRRVCCFLPEPLGIFLCSEDA